MRRRTRRRRVLPMRPRGSALVTTLTLALAVTVTAASPAAAPAAPATAPAAAPAASGRVTASELLPGSVDLTFGAGTDSVVTPDGKLLLASTNAGLSRMTITADHIVRTGTSSRGADGTVLAHPSGRIGYVVRTAPYRQRLQVFDLRSRTPHLLRTLDLPALGKVHGAALTPDGRRLFLTGADTVQILRLGTPARPTKGPTYAVRVGSPAVTPDGTRSSASTPPATPGHRAGVGHQPASHPAAGRRARGRAAGSHPELRTGQRPGSLRTAGPCTSPPPCSRSAARRGTAAWRPRS